MTEKKQQIRDYLAITVGTILIAFAIKNIFDPVSMVTGGVSGAAIILKELWQVPLWLTNTVLNIPLFLAAFRMMGWQFIGRTLYSTAMLSAALYVLPEMGLVKEDMILSALFWRCSQRRGDRACIPWRLYHRRNGYAGRAVRGRAAPLFIGTDHAGFGRRYCSSRRSCVRDQAFFICDDRHCLRIQSYGSPDRRNEVFKRGLGSFQNRTKRLRKR